MIVALIGTNKQGVRLYEYTWQDSISERVPDICTAKHENVPKTKLRAGGKNQMVVTQLSSIWYRRLWLQLMYKHSE